MVLIDSFRGTNYSRIARGKDFFADNSSELFLGVSSESCIWRAGVIRAGSGSDRGGDDAVGPREGNTVYYVGNRTNKKMADIRNTSHFIFFGWYKL